MKEVVSGGAEGELIAWGLGLDGSLYKWAAGSWSLHQPKLATGQKLDGIHDIALSSDGFLCCLSRGLAYEYDAQKQSWDRFRDDALQQGLSFTMISVGSKEAIWAVDSSKTTVYEYKDGSWLAQLDACIAVSVAQDGTIVALNDAGEPYMLDRSTQDGSWIDLSVMGDIMPESSLPGFKGNNQQKIQIESISVQDQAHVYAVTKDAKLVRFTVGQDGVGIWQWLVGTNSAEPFDRGIARGLIDLQVNSTGALFGVTKSGVIYKKGTQGKGARPSLSRVNQPKMKARAGQKPTGRGVTRLSRRALAQGAYADTRVRRLNRGNIKGASLKRVGRPSARRRGPVKVGKVKTQRGAPSERALVGTRTTAGTRIERVAKPRIETARKVGQTRSTPRQRSSGRVIRERSTATAGQLISTAARDARNARKLTSSTQRRAATRSTTGKLSRAERPVRSRVIAQRKPVKTQTSVPRALPPAQAGTRGIDESPSNAVMPSDEEVLSEESDIQEDTEAVFEDEGAESYDEEAFSDEEFSEGEDDMSDLADIGA